MHGLCITSLLPRRMPVKKKNNTALSVLHFLARPNVFFFALGWLMVLLVVGTVQQKYIGLYLAQKTYFSSYMFWGFDLIPLPGGYTTLGLIFVSLLCKLLLEKWTRAKAGTVVIHGGAMLLLLGGFLTAAFSHEGNMVIPEDGSANYISDYHTRELVISSDKKEIAHFDDTDFAEGHALETDALPFEIAIQKHCDNCAISQLSDISGTTPRRGIYEMIDLHTIPPLKENEDNVSGVVFEITGANDQTNGLYAAFEFMPATQFIVVDGNTYSFDIRRKRTPLPFSIKLVDFKKENYPGTETAKAYQSDVILREGDLEWRSIISMNNPLRYRGYTFYQSSFIQAGEQQTTVLAVVKNAGKIFPYIASILICIGLLLHMVLRIPALTKRRDEK